MMAENIRKQLEELEEYGAAGLYENPDRSLFYRKSVGLRRFYEKWPMPEYHGELLYPCGDADRHFFPYNLAIRFEKLHAEKPEIETKIIEEFVAHRSTVPSEHSVGGNMYIHSMPNYERVLKEGLRSYIPRIEKIQDPEMREGLLQIMEGIKAYQRRCVEVLEQNNAPAELINALKKVPMEPAETFYEAVACWNFVMYLDGCDNVGCLAHGLYPYYKGGDVTPLLRALFENVDACSAQGLALHTDYNELTLQCLEAVKGIRRPQIQLFVDETTPDTIWDKACEVIKTGGGQPAFYNPSVLLDGLQKKFNIPDEDIQQYCAGGCTESMLTGLSNVGSIDAGIHLPLILERTIHRELPAAADFEDFYAAYLRDVRNIVDGVTDALIESRQNRSELGPIPMRTLLVDDCIDRGLDFTGGGPRYQWSVVNFAGMINVIDSLLVIRDLVFAEKRYTGAELVRKLADNDANFLKEARNHSVSFGSDHPDANAFSWRVSHDIYTMLDGKSGPLVHGFLPASIQFNTQIWAGRMVGATPDGREAKSPLCDSLGAIFGKDVKGPTALLNSVTSLDLASALGTPVLNFNVEPDFKPEILKALIKGYMKQGGVQMQLTCVSREMLEEAYREPEKHKNIVVRVGGYSEYFYLLDDELKRMVISRTIQK